MRFCPPTNGWRQICSNPVLPDTVSTVESPCSTASQIRNTATVALSSSARKKRPHGNAGVTAIYAFQAEKPFWHNSFFLLFPRGMYLCIPPVE
jgi:hypothetical protein